MKNIIIKTYILLQSFPGVTAGTKFFFQDGKYYYKNDLEENCWIKINAVENNPSWFKKFVDVNNKIEVEIRIAVTDTNKPFLYVFHSGREIAYENLDYVRKYLEACLI